MQIIQTLADLPTYGPPRPRHGPRDCGRPGCCFTTADELCGPLAPTDPGRFCLPTSVRPSGPRQPERAA